MEIAGLTVEQATAATLGHEIEHATNVMTDLSGGDTEPKAVDIGDSIISEYRKNETKEEK